MSWNTLAPAGPPDLTGIDAPIDAVRRCCRAAIVSGSAGVTKALSANAAAYQQALQTESGPRDVLSLGVALVMLVCAGEEIDLSAVAPAIDRARATAAPAEALRLSLLAAAAGAFTLSHDVWSAVAELDNPLAELACCIVEGPLDGLRVPWESFLRAAAARTDADVAVDVILVAAAAQLRVHLLTVDRGDTLDALSRELCGAA